MAGDDRSSLAAVLRGLREDAGLSQEELARRAGLSAHAISALERGTRTRPYPHTLRSLAEALALSEADRSRLIAAVPPRARPARAASDAATARPRDLPVPTTPLLGRDEDVRRVGRLLAEHRLVTLSGAGGVGKTRLALAVAGQVRDRYADGVALVELAPLMESSAVLPAVADAVEATRGTGRSAVEDVVERIRGQHLLLVLDNLEHLLDAAPDVAALIEAAPDLTVLATSRAPLRLRGETEVAVEPLGLPSATTRTSDSPAGRLLLDRAAAVSPGWGTDPAEDAFVAATCVRLAGLPLALELAAARARLLDPATLLARLDTALQDGPRDLPARQRTMRATLDWSHGLLGEDERRLLRLLGVFVGGFTLDDLEAVVERTGAPAGSSMALLASLVEHSLVTTAPGGTRFRMLEPVAQYARSLLVEAGEWEAADAAHAAHFLVPGRGHRPPLPRRGPGRRPGPHRPRAPQPDGRGRADARRRRRAGSRPDGVGAVALLVAARPPRPRAAARRDGAGARGAARDVHARAALAAATMAFAMDDVDAALDWWEERPPAHGGRPGHRLQRRGRDRAGRPRPRRPRHREATVRRRARARGGGRGGVGVDLGAGPHLARDGGAAAGRPRRGRASHRGGPRVRSPARRPPGDVHRPLQPRPGRARPR